MPTMEQRIEILWEDVYNQRVLIHAYMLTQMRRDSELIFERVYFPERKGDLRTRLIQIQDMKVMEPDTFWLVNDSRLARSENPYTLVERKLHEEIGDIEQLRVYTFDDNTGIRFWDVYRQAFDMEHPEQFRRIMVEGIVRALTYDAPGSIQLEPVSIPTSDDSLSDIELWTLYFEKWSILLGVSSHSEIDVSYFYETAFYKNSHNKAVIVGLAFSEAIQALGTKHAIHLINLLAFLKLIAELKTLYDDGLLETARSNFLELFPKGRGGLTVISTWVEKLRSSS